MTLAGVEAITRGHLEAEEVRERRAIAAIRLAVWGDEDDLRRHFGDGSGRGGAPRIAEVDEALAAFGLREDGP